MLPFSLESRKQAGNTRPTGRKHKNLKEIEYSTVVMVRLKSIAYCTCQSRFKSPGIDDLAIKNEAISFWLARILLCGFTRLR